MKAVLMLLIATAFCFRFAVASASHSMTVDDLHRICTSPDDANKSACQFFIFGLAMGASLEAIQAGDHTRYCIPENQSAAAIEFRVKAIMAQDLMFFPSDKDLDAVGYVGAAIFKSYPCTKPH